MFLNRISPKTRYDFYRKVLATNKRSFIRNNQKDDKPQSKVMRYTKPLLNGFGVGIVVGIGYAVYTSYKNKDVHMIHERRDIFTLDEPPKCKVVRKIVNSKDKHNLDLILFQFQTCPFCSKVRTFLDSSSFSYSVVEVDAVLKQDVKWSPYKKVPIVLARDKSGKYVQMTDSTAIISILSSYLIDPSVSIRELVEMYPEISYINSDGKKTFEILNKYHLMYGEKVLKNINKDDLEYERKWREWTDKTFIHLISPNVYRTLDESFETFEWFASISGWNEYFPRWERNLMVYVGAYAMYLIAKRLKKRHKLSEDVRQDIYEACNSWTNELTQRKSKFAGGNKPNLADLALFGALMSMEGCQAFSDILANTKIGPWIDAMKKHAHSNRGEVIKTQ